jgi:NADPH:quinone reductase-like Zn-dependent oxidoreductase
MAPRAKREAAWATLVEHLDRKQLAAMTTVAPLSDLPRLADEILAGQVRGRVVVDVSA